MDIRLWTAAEAWRRWALPLGERCKRRWQSSRGQAVLEYFVLFIFLSLIAAAVYHFMSPIIEKTLVKMADTWIAKNVAGETSH